MKKIVLSSTVMILFGIYTFLVRSGDISAELFKSSPIPVKLINNDLQNNSNTPPTASPSNNKTTPPPVTTSNTGTTKQVTKEVCTYIPSSRNDEENYNSDEGGRTGYYKCTTIIVPAPETTVTTIGNVSQNVATPPKKTTPPASVVVTPPPVIKPKVVGIYKDGTFIGDIADAYYGNVQVSATISNGRLSDISFLDYPQDRRTSLEKSSYAMPILKSEAISAQNANVNTVSSVTYTSEAFITSLSSALAQAKI